MARNEQFDRNKMFTTVQDSRYNILYAPTKLDSDSEALYVDEISPVNNTGDTWNLPEKNVQCKFQIDLGSSSAKADLENSFLEIDLNNQLLKPADGATSPYTAETTHWTWNTFEIIESINIKVGDSSEVLEEYNTSNDFGASMQFKLLHQYSYDTLSNMDTILFTPILNNKINKNVTDISAEAAQRTTNYWLDKNTINKKCIPLSMIFSSLDRPAYMNNARKLFMDITFKNANTWKNMGFFANLGSVGIENRVNVKGVKLMLISSRVTVPQAIASTSEKVSGKTENLGYLYYYINKHSYGGSPIQLTPIGNCQYIGLGIKATNIDATYVDPTQYLRSWNNYSVSYGNSTIPSTGSIDISTSQNHLYELYRYACGRSGASKDGQPAIPRKYFNFCFMPIIKLWGSSLFKESRGVQRVQINANGKTPDTLPTVDMSICLMTMQAAQISPDGVTTKALTSY